MRTRVDDGPFNPLGFDQRFISADPTSPLGLVRPGPGESLEVIPSGPLLDLKWHDADHASGRFPDTRFKASLQPDRTADNHTQNPAPRRCLGHTSSNTPSTYTLPNCCRPFKFTLNRRPVAHPQIKSVISISPLRNEFTGPRALSTVSKISIDRPPSPPQRLYRPSAPPPRPPPPADRRPQSAQAYQSQTAGSGGPHRPGRVVD